MYKKGNSQPLALWEKVRVGLIKTDDKICQNCWDVLQYTVVKGDICPICHSNRFLPEWIVELSSSHRGKYEQKLIERRNKNES